MHRALGPLAFLRDGLRTKPRIALAVGLGVFAASATWTFTRPRIYEATASFIETPQPEVIHEGALVCGGGIDTLIHVTESSLIARRVSGRLGDLEMAKLMPEDSARDPDAVVEFLKAKRRVVASALVDGVDISFRHPNPSMATHLATLFADEMRTWLERVQKDDYNRTLEDIDLRIGKLRKQVEDQESSPTTAAELAKARGDLEKYADWRHRLAASPPKAHAAIPAVLPAPDAYIEPDIPLHLGLSLLNSVILGLSAAAVAARASPTPAAPSQPKT